MYKKLLPLILFNVAILLHSQSLEVPKVTSPESLIEKNFYILQYNEKFEQADWVAYELTKNEVLGPVKRKDSFKSDSSIKTGSATLNDYKGSGYDRGHLAPAADMKMTSGSMADSFFMSNMSPQDPGFNRGIWSKLESAVRSWAYENESIYIATGPVLTKSSYPTIGSNKVAIPEYYFKVILDYTKPEIKAIGFILPNEKSSKPLQSYAVSVDEVESFTGIDFYPMLPDNIEEKLESSFDISLWPIKQFSSDGKTAINAEKVEAPEQYWINSSSNTRHNPSCRYYGNTKKGYYTDQKIGKACSSCGG